MVISKESVANWDVGEVVLCKKTERGVSNNNWIIETTRGKYILRKVAEDKRLKELEFELDYLTYLKQGGFEYNIPMPIKAVGGKFFLKIKGSYYWMYEFISGSNLEQLGKSELEACAKMMASYHKIIEESGLKNSVKPGDVFERKGVLSEMKMFERQLLKKIRLTRGDKIFLGELIKLVPLLESLNESKCSMIKKYPLHRDINPENILWKKGRLVGVIDFENVGMNNSPLIKDIAVTLQYSCRDKHDSYKLDLKLARFFLKEYRKHHSLSKDEIACISDIIVAGAIEDFGYAYWMLVNDPGRAKLYRLKLYSKVAQWFDKNKKKIIEGLKK